MTKIAASVNRELFGSKNGFCYKCGSILPLYQNAEGITCYTCKNEYSRNEEEQVDYTIYFNTNIESSTNMHYEMNETVGPIVERKCSKCGFDKMSYMTLQLRSADEGQTVFFSCVRCKYKESENS